MSRRSLLPPEDRAKLLARRRREGLTYPELSAQSGISVGTLKVWARRAAMPAKRSGFVELTARPSLSAPASPVGFAVEVAGGRIVHVHAGFDAKEFRQLLAVLEEQC